MKALILSGGSIMGAFQVGAIRWLLNNGFVPDLVYGISVGALNGGFLVDRSGRMARKNQPIKWGRIGDDLESFWTKNVKGPNDLVTPRRWLLLNAFRKRFDGLMGTEPLRRMIFDEVIPTNLTPSPLDFEIGAVNMETGEIVYANKLSPQIREYIHASTAIPIVMPMVDVPVGNRKVPFYDGGVRDIAPLGHAINIAARNTGQKLTEIVIIVCQPDTISGGEFRRGDLRDLTSRLMDIVTTEIVENDLKFANLINDLITAAGTNTITLNTKTYHKIKTCLIRPEKSLDVKIQDFDTSDLQRMFAEGKRMAQKEYSAATNE